MKKTLLLFSLGLLFITKGITQRFTHADSLRGNYGPSRNWWDVTKYDLHVTFNFSDSSISGYNDMQYKRIHPGTTMQIDLQQPLTIDSILFTKQVATGSILVHYFPGKSFRDIVRDGNAYFIHVTPVAGDTISSLRIFYHGRPLIAKRPPWLPGGVVWKKDAKNRPWVSIACQGQGASVWYPCKDHQADEPDSAEMHITCPDTLLCVGNGRFRGKLINQDGTATYDWAVVNPINNYCIVPYIGKYVSFHDNYPGEKGNLDMDYWVLDYNLEKAKVQFQDAGRMMKAFEYWFGPYPFYEDGYKLVDAPYIGMENQSDVAYGNGYRNGYHNSDLSESGWGLKWDYIIIHESGHEWFANNITTRDVADMWVHEGFTTYSECLFTEFYYGKLAADAYVTGLRSKIQNKQPVISEYNVNDDEGDKNTDMYYKGANMIHTIRQVIGDDVKFRDILRGLNKTFYHKTVTSRQIENYISKQSGINLSKVFDQYLRTPQVPTLEYKMAGGVLNYRWVHTVPGFNMPVKVKVDSETYKFIYPNTSWKQIFTKQSDLQVDVNFYVFVKKD